MTTSRLDLDVTQFLVDLDAIEDHAESQRPTEGDDQRGRVANAAMVLSEYVMAHGGAT